MLFRRKIPLNLWQKMRQMLWPKRGWSRAFLYIWHRLVRLKDSAHGVAAGVASGVAISFTPFMGFHLIGAMGIAFAARGNVLAAWAGTLVGNPWTFPFIWMGTYRLGNWIIGGTMGEAAASGLSFDLLVHHPTQALGPLLLPMAIGGLPLALISWFVTYWLARRSIERFQAARRIKLEMVRKKVLNHQDQDRGGGMKRA
ncbi:hypothetical protein AQ1_01743 [alpha proteobacterium Q-1]|nr:hypothetical protein AQ1_01743 [alpha proteobacterium Q-1]